MAAPSTYAQFELGSNTYTTLLGILWTPGPPQMIVHTVPSSVTHPVKWMDRGPATLEGTLQLAGSGATALVTDLQTETIRHASWVGPNAVAVYCHVYAAEVTGWTYLAGPYGAAAATKLVQVSFKFTCPDQRLYLYSDNSTLVGA